MQVSVGTSAGLGVPYGPLGAGVQGLAGGQQGARRRVGGRAQVTGEGLAGILGQNVRLSLHTGAAHG